MDNITYRFAHPDTSAKVKSKLRTMARDLAPDLVEGETGPGDENAARSDLSYIRALVTLRQMIDSHLATATYLAGTDRGASYADIGEAAGISRQAARTRWPHAKPDAKPGRPARRSSTP